MKNLVGQSFAIADGRYRIVDVRRCGTNAMVYAELLDGHPARPATAAEPTLPPRTAFRYGDIADFLDDGCRA